MQREAALGAFAAAVHPLRREFGAVAAIDQRGRCEHLVLAAEAHAAAVPAGTAGIRNELEAPQPAGKLALQDLDWGAANVRQVHRDAGEAVAVGGGTVG